MTLPFRIRFVCAALVFASLAAGGSRVAGQAPPPAPVTPLAADAPFTVAVATAVVEAAPVYIAKEGAFGSQFQYINGGVRTLQNNGAHAAGNATTQMLVVLRDNPKVRLLFTLVNGNYRIVAKRSAGISKLADLKGKRVVTPRTTSAHYHLVALLRTAGLQESDVTIVSAPATAMAAAVAKGDADAISMWEPESQNAVEALGKDAIIFQDNTVYRELYSIYSTTDVLNDPRRRKELVAFVREIIRTTGELQKEPSKYFDLISRVTKHPARADRPVVGAPQLPPGGGAGSPQPAGGRGEVGGRRPVQDAADARRAGLFHRHLRHRRSAQALTAAFRRG